MIVMESKPFLVSVTDYSFPGEEEEIFASVASGIEFQIGIVR